MSVAGSTGSLEGRATVRPSTSRQGLEEAYRDAATTASRTSLLGALGFGVALVMGLRLAGEDAFFTQGFGLDMMLLAGGIGGGIVFTALALRATRAAKVCRIRLDELDDEHGMAERSRGRRTRPSWPRSQQTRPGRRNGA